MKTGICPKCNSHDIFSGARVALKKGPFGSNSIPIGLTSIAALDNFVCGECGYVESYVSDRQKLIEIVRKWEQVQMEEVEKTDD